MGRVRGPRQQVMGDNGESIQGDYVITCRMLYRYIQAPSNVISTVTYVMPKVIINLRYFRNPTNMFIIIIFIL